MSACNHQAPLTPEGLCYACEVERLSAQVEGLSLDAELLEWLVHHPMIRIRGKEGSWFVMDCRQGLSALVEPTPSYQAALSAARQKLASEIPQS